MGNHPSFDAMDGGGIILLILIGMTGMVLLAFATIFFYLRNIRARDAYRRMMEEHAREIEVVQKEIYLGTLKDVSKELHDNLGGILSAVKMELSMAINEESARDVASNGLNRLYDLREMVNVLGSELRDISKNLANDGGAPINLLNKIEKDISVINRSGAIKASCKTVGRPSEISNKTALILYRMVQESLSNTLCHSKADCIDIEVIFKPRFLRLLISDNGSGFDSESIVQRPESSKGLGLINMFHRSKLLNGSLVISSKPGHGTLIDIAIPI